MPGPCLNSWRTDACEWSIGDVWRSSDVVERAIFISLALMLAYTVFVLFRFSRCYNLARRESNNLNPESSQDSRWRERRLVADLIPGLGMLRGIATAAPFLGLAGTSYGILAALSVGYSGSRYWFVPVMFARISAALITAAVGILVAIPAMLLYNFLRSRMEALSVPSLMGRRRGEVDLGSFHFAQTLRLKRFAVLPHYALIAAPVLACVVMLLMVNEPYQRPTGLPVRLPRDHCEPGLIDRTIVLRVTDGGKLFLNTEPEDWNGLGTRLSEIYRLRQDRVLYLEAQDGVRFQIVADAIDFARNPATGAESLGITVWLITPQTEAENALCHAPIWTGSSAHRKKQGG